jgi:hypothetical protein
VSKYFGRRSDNMLGDEIGPDLRERISMDCANSKFHKFESAWPGFCDHSVHRMRIGCASA